MIIPEKAEVMIQMIRSKRLLDETHIQNRSYLLLEGTNRRVLGVKMIGTSRAPCKFTHLLPVLVSSLN